MAVLAAMGTLLAVGLAFAAPSRGLRAACLLLVPLFVATLYLTYSRGGWLALALGLLALLALRMGCSTAASSSASARSCSSP